VVLGAYGSRGLRLTIIRDIYPATYRTTIIIPYHRPPYVLANKVVLELSVNHRIPSAAVMFVIKLLLDDNCKMVPQSYSHTIHILVLPYIYYSSRVRHFVHPLCTGFAKMFGASLSEATEP
jgi:hypothetical protein